MPRHAVPPIYGIRDLYCVSGEFTICWLDRWRIHAPCNPAIHFDNFGCQKMN